MIGLLLGEASMVQDSCFCLALCCGILIMKLLSGSLVLSASYLYVFRGTPRATRQVVESSECPWVKFAQRRHFINCQREQQEWMEVQRYFDSLPAGQ